MSSARPRIAYVYPDDFSLWHFHGRLLEEAIGRGAEVHAITAPGPWVPALERLGASHHPLALPRFVGPVADLGTLLGLTRLFRRLRPDLVHAFTIKPNVFGSLAASLAGVPRTIATVEGLGLAFAEPDGLRARALARIATRLYRLAGRRAERVWFVNPDDRDLLVGAGAVPPARAWLTESAGVDVTRFDPARVDRRRADELRRELAPDGALLVTLVAARMLKSKGVLDFAAAAALLSERFPDARFVLVGPVEPANPDAIPEAWLRALAATRNVRWRGFERDVRELYAASDLVVLPSYYREGVPNVLLEAMALARPIVTTDSVGCRSAVEPGVNGYRVPPRDPAALAAAIGALLADRELRLGFGCAGRRLAVSRFSKDAIVERVVAELYGLAPAARAPLPGQHVPGGAGAAARNGAGGLAA